MELSQQDINFLSQLKKQGVGMDEAFRRLDAVRTQTVQSQPAQSQEKTGVLSSVIDFFNPAVEAAGQAIEGVKQVGSGVSDIVTGVSENNPEKAFGGLAKGVIGTTKTVFSPATAAMGVAEKLPIVGDVAKMGNKLVGAGIETIQKPIQYAQDNLVENMKSQGLTDEEIQNHPTYLALEAAKQISPVVVADLAGRAIKSKTGQKVISKAGDVIKTGSEKAVSSIKSGAEKVAPMAKKVGEEALSKSTGLEKETSKFAYNEPLTLEKAQRGEITRDTVAKKVIDSLDTLENELGYTGKKYSSIKNEPLNVTINKKSLLKDTLSNFGITVKNGKLNFSDSSIGNLSSQNSIKQAISEVLSKKFDTVKDVLSTRGKLDDLIDWNSGTTTKGQAVIKAIRKAVDDVAKGNKSLAELDSRYGELADMFKRIKKGIIDSSGKVTDNAMSKIANLTKKGNEKALARIEKLSPGITSEINAIRALEDIERASGNKIGAYTRGGLGIMGLSGNIPALAASILSNPDVATGIIKKIGKLKK